MKEFAFYISNSKNVAAITRNMWRVSIYHSRSSPRPLYMNTSNQHVRLEHRLVLHLLRSQLAARCYLARHRPALVSLPSTRFKLPMDAALGNCRYQDKDGADGCLDILLCHIWWRPRL